MKLLLTSGGLSDPKIAHTFLSLILKDPLEAKVIFVPTAARTEEELKFVDESRQELLQLRIRPTNLKELDLSGEINKETIMGCDAIYVCGGNTFYLMDCIRKTRFDVAAEQFLMSGGVYLGVSAGSMVATPSIAIAGVEPADPNDVGLTDLRGMGFVDFEVSPHVPEIVPYENVEKYSQTTERKVYAIDNNSGVLVQDKVVSTVGDGKYKIYN